jgi:hypothetical protein
VIERDRERMTVNQTVSSRFPTHQNLEGVNKIDPEFQSHQMSLRRSVLLLVPLLFPGWIDALKTINTKDGEECRRPYCFSIA